MASVWGRAGGTVRPSADLWTAGTSFRPCARGAGCVRRVGSGILGRSVLACPVKGDGVRRTPSLARGRRVQRTSGKDRNAGGEEPEATGPVVSPDQSQGRHPPTGQRLDTAVPTRRSPIPEGQLRSRSSWANAEKQHAWSLRNEHRPGARPAGAGPTNVRPHPRRPVMPARTEIGERVEHH